MSLIFRLSIQTVAILIASYILSGIEIETFWTALVVAVILGIVNILLKPILVILTLPITIFTFGLFIFVINSFLVILVSAIVPGFEVDGFWWALLFSLIVSLVSSFLENLNR